MQRAPRYLTTSVCKYSAPAVHGSKITLTPEDLNEVLSDILDVNPTLVRAGWTLRTLLANPSITKGELLQCCEVKKLPTRKWHISFRKKQRYIMLSGRKGKPAFAKYHRGASHARLPPESPECWKPTPSFTSPPPSSPRPHRNAKSLLTGGDFECEASPPASPASLVGNQPYQVQLHRWAALAVEPDHHLDYSMVLHTCGRPRCICVAHHQFGTRDDNSEDDREHRKHAGRAARSYPPR